MNSASDQRLIRRIRAARGQENCDLLIQNVSYLDVFSCSWKKGDIAIRDGSIVGLDPGYQADRVINGKGKWVVPGFIDAHVHVESSMMLPSAFQDAVLMCGTTSAICDPHELANVLGLPGLQYFLDSSELLDMDLWVQLSSCVPATHLETNGGGELSAHDLLSVAGHARALGLAEMMNMPGVLNGDQRVIEKLTHFSGRPLDGHCPLLRGKDLSAYAATGISSCHESSELEEAREKLSKGIACWVREGSVAKDLETLIPLLSVATSSSMGFCTDDRNPLDIAIEGHVDHLIRRSIQLGVAPELAYRVASWTVARHYGLDRGFYRVGAVAPGYLADLVLLGDAKTCSIDRVFKRGRPADELESADSPEVRIDNSIRCESVTDNDLKGVEGRVHVIGVEHGKIITSRSVEDSKTQGLAHLSVLERYGRGSKPANAYVRGFGENFKGAIASSVGHDSHNLIAVGSNTADMALAMNALRDKGGGFCVSQNGSILTQLDLPFGGLMSSKTPTELKKELNELKKAGTAAGCELPEPFLQLAFLSLPVIPSLKLTDKGLVDVDQFQIIPVRVT